MNSWTLKEFRGSAALEFLLDLAALRIKVFREFPYLYEGDLDYEKKYLSTYFSCPESFIALCFSEKKIVGATTAIPLDKEEPSFREPFVRSGYAAEDVCYYGESVLLSECRGRGIGKAFMNAREKYALTLGKKYASFCAVVRPIDHKKRPADYRPLDGFWEKEGFKKIVGLTTKYSWKEVGEASETEKQMQYWLKELK